MNQPWVYWCSPPWTPVTPPSPSHPSGSSQCTSPEHPVSCIEPGLAICFTYDNTHVSMLFSQIIPPSPSPTESKKFFFTSVPFAVSETDFKETRVSCRTHGKEVSQAQNELEYDLQDSICLCVCVCVCVPMCTCLSVSVSFYLLPPSLPPCFLYCHLSTSAQMNIFKSTSM